jgi:hypothetical protein
MCFRAQQHGGGHGKPGRLALRVFSLGPAAGGARPLTFSFAYKLENPVAAKNNIIVLLRFYDSTGAKIIGQRVV